MRFVDLLGFNAPTVRFVLGFSPPAMETRPSDEAKLMMAKATVRGIAEERGRC